MKIELQKIFLIEHHLINIVFKLNADQIIRMIEPRRKIMKTSIIYWNSYSIYSQKITLAWQRLSGSLDKSIFSRSCFDSTCISVSKKMKCYWSWWRYICLRLTMSNFELMISGQKNHLILIRHRTLRVNNRKWSWNKRPPKLDVIDILKKLLNYFKPFHAHSHFDSVLWKMLMVVTPIIVCIYYTMKI